LVLILAVSLTTPVPTEGGDDARLHSTPPLIMLKPGGPPKLGLQVRLPKGVAEVNARKEMARAIMAEGIMNRE